MERYSGGLFFTITVIVLLVWLLVSDTAMVKECEVTSEHEVGLIVKEVCVNIIKLGTPDPSTVKLVWPSGSNKLGKR